MTTTLNLVLYEPEIPQNTGNLIRLVVNMGASLHLIHPLGFDLSEKAVRRAGLDYHDLATVSEHANFQEFIRQEKPEALYAFSTRGKTFYTEARFQRNDYLLFGPETRGLPGALLQELPANRVLRLPMVLTSRSMNLSNTVAVAAYEAWRQIGFEGGI